MLITTSTLMCTGTLDITFFSNKQTDECWTAENQRPYMKVANFKSHINCSRPEKNSRIHKKHEK